MKQTQLVRVAEDVKLKAAKRFVAALPGLWPHYLYWAVKAEVTIPAS